ncbi:uncharacterized protein DUF4132 [Marinobacterium halophilum]|uniref:Uncharacterized protein DUF4132 n=1 Tax=Marinobacterium halophilum TaxID=267374 RepID=A0A2P8ESX2_9GAMM|nr:DUF4132 domain-containing protein [Marinobacterium halophilum]PSL12535.1 uncharacterized protein DUF4132 [Marinobacterium halophilum]
MNAIVERFKCFTYQLPVKIIDPESPEFRQIEESLLRIEEHIMADITYIYSSTRLPFKECPDYERIKKAPSDEKLAFICYIISKANSYKPPHEYHFSSQELKRYYVLIHLLDSLMRTRIDFPSGFSFNYFFHYLYHFDDVAKEKFSITDRPFVALVMLIEKHIKRCGLDAKEAQDLMMIIQHEDIRREIGGSDAHSQGEAVGKAAKKLQRLIMDSEGNDSAEILPYEFGSGVAGRIFADELDTLPEEQRNLWYLYFHHIATASGGKPAQKFLTSANTLIDNISITEFKRRTNTWLSALAQLKVEEKNTVFKLANGKDYSYRTYEFIESHSFNLLKGMLWSLSRFHDNQTLKNIALLTEKCFQKVPEQGPAAASVGNAGIYTLAQSKGLEGISHLSRLKLRIRQNNTQKLIQKYIEEQAAKQGITPAQIEEIAAPDFALVNGERTEMFDDYRLVLRHTGVGAAELQWYKPDDNPQKSVPAFVKNSAKHSAKLKKLRDLVKQVKQASTSQRDRIDRLYLEQMSWTPESFSKHYLNHGLVSLIARKLIWNLDGQPALYNNDQWQDVHGKPVALDTVETITFWHPLDSNADQVLAWRDRLDQLEIRQPIKQAYREIYILTDAEINTRVYSNRMAAHILKQHQFNSLAALRGWKYSLLGAYDDGRDGEIARKQLPAYNMQAQFWINEILDDNDSFNDVGIWYYVATDQLRFVDANDEPIAMVDIPPLVLSEVMRDLDLFVGVASVGNDPEWQDGGPDARPAYRDYWHSYSFGDLTEVAKTRKTVLERLLPRLKIRDKAVIEGKFLFVTGTRHTYKIHIGSGNILIAPNDRYLCIVPGRGKDKKVEQVFLPFEGDHGLSIVLSKAFMLAEDNKITDETILSQL